MNTKFIMVGILLISMATTATATTHTVCSSGCDYTSIQDAIDAASGNDTVYVYNGTYYEPLRILTDYLTIEGEGAEVVTVINATGNIFDVDASHTTIKNIGTNSVGSSNWAIGQYGDYDYNTYSSCIINNTEYGIYLNAANNTHNTVYNNTLINIGNMGVKTSEGTNIIIEKNTISGAEYGIVYRKMGTDNTIVGNVITGCTNGVQGSSYCFEMLIYNNYFANNTNHAIGTITNVTWNIPKTSGINIIGGDFLGGNHWDTYGGKDTDCDGLGNTRLPFNNDYLPLCQKECNIFHVIITTLIDFKNIFDPILSIIIGVIRILVFVSIMIFVVGIVTVVMNKTRRK